MERFKNKELDNYYATDAIVEFANFAESNLHNVGRYNGSLSLYRKCLYIKRQDSLLFKYGENHCDNIYNLKQYMRRCCREINLWKNLNYWW